MSTDMNTFTSLISVAELAELHGAENLVVIDCCFNLLNPDWGRMQYNHAHIPGAIYAHLNEDLSGDINPPVTGRHPLPELDDIVGTLGRWGIKEDTQVVAYDDKGGMFAARLWWLLRWLGHERVAVLDGGLRHWQEQGHAVSNEVPEPQAATFVPRPRPELLVSADEVLAVLDDPKVLLVDARTRDRFQGQNEKIDPVAGHIPGAVCAPFIENLDERDAMLGVDKLRQHYQSLLGELAVENSIAYCGSGVTAAHNLLAMYHAGMGEARLYAGSWSHWIADQGRPVET